MLELGPTHDGKHLGVFGKGPDPSGTESMRNPWSDQNVSPEIRPKSPHSWVQFLAMEPEEIVRCRDSWERRWREEQIFTALQEVSRCARSGHDIRLLLHYLPDLQKTRFRGAGQEVIWESEMPLRMI